MNARKWMMEYGVAMVLAFLLAMVLGNFFSILLARTIHDGSSRNR